MIEVLEPQDRLVQQFVDSIYVLKKDTATLDITAYPTVNTPVALFRNATLSLDQGCVHMTHTDTPNHFAMGCNQFSSITRLQYIQLVDEIAINFKPLGFAAFTRSKPAKEKVFPFYDWDALLPDLFHNVFTADSKEQQLGYIEKMLLSQYQPLPDEALLLKALALLNDITTDYKM